MSYSNLKLKQTTNSSNTNHRFFRIVLVEIETIESLSHVVPSGLLTSLQVLKNIQNQM